MLKQAGSHHISSLSCRFLIVAAVLGAVALSYVITSSCIPTSTGSAQVTKEANEELKRAIIAVSEAEAAGAEERRLGVLVEQLNLVLSMIDESERSLLLGDVESATAKAQRSIEISKRAVMDAAKLRNEASQSAQYRKVLTFAVVPFVSLIVTVGVHYGWKWWHRREVDRLFGMEIKGIRDSEGKSNA